MRKKESNSRQRDILEKRSKGMIVAVCSDNLKVRRIVSGKKDINAFFLDNLKDVAIPEYDLVLVDMEMCQSNLDVSRMRSKRTVFFMAELNSASIEKLLYNFGIGEHLYQYTFQGNQYSLDLDEVIYFESDNRVINAFHTSADPARFYGKLDDVQDDIDDYVFFLRVSKSRLVNYNHCNINGYNVEIEGEVFTVTRKYRQEFKKRLDIIKNM